MKVFSVLAAAAFIIGAFASQKHELFSWNAFTWLLIGLAGLALELATSYRLNRLHA